jgi:hypothetical protein
MNEARLTDKQEFVQVSLNYLITRLTFNVLAMKPS